MRPFGWKVLRRIGAAVWLAGFFLFELVVASVQVAKEAATPRHHMTPAIVRVPIRSRSDLEVTLLANLITLTPGTLTLEIAADHSALFVHGLYVSDRDEFRARLAKLEDKLLAVLR